MSRNERTIAGPGAGPERVAHDRGAGGGEDAGADGGADAQRGEMPLAEGALEPAALRDVVFAVLHGLPSEELLMDLIAAKMTSLRSVTSDRIRSCACLAA